jgi:hypothetical protein
MVIMYQDDRQEFGVLFVGSVTSALHKSIQKNLETKLYNFPEPMVGFA